MSIFRQIRVGDQLPDTALAVLIGDEPQAYKLHDLIRDRNVVVVGLPGAFTPTCSRLHLPDLIGNAARLQEAGIEDILCIAPNDPWVLREWARRFGDVPITFLSDGNLEFTQRCGLATANFERFLGQRSARYLMVVRNTIVQRLNIESDAFAVTCTRASDVFAEA
jgi:glutaredoxin/glutathione-dependent peroxiredoxin